MGDIAALLAARASKLKGTNVGNLEKEAEERRKKTLLAMKQSEEEHGRVGTFMKVTPGVGEATDEAKESPALDATETAPPAEEEEEEESEGESDDEDEEAKKKEEEEAKKKK